MDKTSKIRLVVVDDHILFRRGLVAILSEMPGYVVVGEAGDGEEAIRVIGKSKPELVLMDVNMPVMSGVEALHVLRQSWPNLKVLMLTVSQADNDLIGAIAAGANGYLLKSAEPDVLDKTIKQIVAGNSVLSPEVTERVLETLRVAQQNQAQSLLSAREIEVLKLMARGLSTRQIADSLVISENTAKTHIRHIFEKLEVDNRADAVARAVEKHYLAT